ncbi:L-alanine-DL-glutamate epimerase-like enolase superfamily enzyme [Sinorhizobium fredii]|uniref:L-alanine-DL-glutamate epimerase-like protein n=1 Tax=Sinorhizobium fredii (strain USDA 257) TaxID=1185652 RepID=I3X3I1_SINF2|nr:enolase C-terminal domain-like protein [Sinorhizobium fredii]AFL50437.1 L-alanine-DL-glutamate epimerase-like protein [Sinorhizobium fredii USDA 257]
MTRGGIRINRVELAVCRLPLEKPVLLGSVRVESRDYVCLRVVTNAGVEGFSIGYRSGSNLFEALQIIAPRLIGRDALMRQAFNLEFETAHIPARAGYVRALSLIDVALWDIAAKAAGIPLYILLGGLRTEVPAMPVVGFSYAERAIAEIEDEIERHCGDDETLLKVMIKGPDVAANTRYIHALASRFAGKANLAVDTHWSWRSISEALETCRRIDDCNLAFIEDPFLPQQWRLAGELRAKLKTPVAVGEDVLDPYGFLDLVQNVDVLRVDATGSGGVMAAMNAIALAAAHGRRVLPHVFPYLHLHIACAQKTVMAVEYIPEHTGTDPIRKLLTEFPTIKRGKFQVSDQPGAGCALQWTAVREHAESACTFE